MSPVNDYEFRVFGLRRSGNHALISWIMGHFPDNSVYYFNDVQRIEERNFFSKSLNFPVNLFEWKDRYIYPGETKSRLIKDERDYLQIHNYSTMVKNSKIANKLVDKNMYLVANMRTVDKSCLIQSYEDQPLEIVDLINQQDIGVSNNQFNVLIVRNVCNMIASRLEHKNYHTTMSVEIVELWKQYAYEFLGYTSLFGGNKIVVSYDHWLESKEYRRMLSEKINLEFSDDGFKCVTNFGGGSSFKSVGSEQKYNSRYESYLDNQEYIEYALDPELFLLNDSVQKMEL